MKIKEIMSQDVEVIYSTDSLQTAARKMRDRDIGALPVYDGEHLIGVLSDRDIVVRALVDGMGAGALIGRDLATAPVIYCYEDQDVSDAAQIMQNNRIRRILVLDRKNRQLTGVLALSDLAMNGDDKLSTHVLQSVSEPVIVG
jgi:CBS domain-containing protein